MLYQDKDLNGLRFLAGRLCLDFVNSVENRAGARPEDLIASYTALVRWGKHRELFTGDQAERLIALAARQPGMAAAVLDEALAYREALHRVFVALATAREPASADLDMLQDVYGRAISHARLQRTEGRFVWDWPAGDTQLDWLLWPIAYSAIELLTEGKPGRIKICANPDGCGWLFYDGSKNGSRRWCSMEGCGSQVKMRRQYAKRREPGTGAGTRGRGDAGCAPGTTK